MSFWRNSSEASHTGSSSAFDSNSLARSLPLSLSSSGSLAAYSKSTTFDSGSSSSGTLEVGDGVLSASPVHRSGKESGTNDVGVPAAEGHVRFGEVGIEGKRRLEQVADLAGEASAKRRDRTHGLSVSANSVGGLEVRLGVGLIGAHGLLGQPHRAFEKPPRSSSVAT